ncbi:relaxase domain-containing protein [Streptomyces sp. 3N207]|uniref:relaxase domain-containing protein n=1 Tax=Streptomyces sp. 3N207 TaxID=3457417 RepID=UPI003FD45ACB
MWRYYLRGVAVGDGVRPARKPLVDAQEEAGLPPGVWMGRGLPAVRLTAGAVVTERQAELLFGQGRHPDADGIKCERLDDGDAPETARLATVLGQPVEEIEKRKQIPLLALDFVFRPQASLTVLWALGDERTWGHRACARAGHRHRAALAGRRSRGDSVVLRPEACKGAGFGRRGVPALRQPGRLPPTP